MYYLCTYRKDSTIFGMYYFYLLMNKFFKYFLAAFIAFFAAILLLFFGLFGSMLFSGDDDLKLSSNSVLHLDFENEIIERQNLNDFNINPMSFKLIEKDGLDMIIDQIYKAKVDPDIEGIFLDFRQIQTGLASVQEIREALADFKTSNKWVVGYSDYLSQSAYYLASVADELYVEPEGTIEFKGLMSKVTFLKGSLEKLGVDMQVIRPKNNKFKSAVEPYLLDSMSASNEIQLTKILDGLWGNMINNISTDRGVGIDKLMALADDFTGMDIRKSAAEGLVTGAKYRDEVESIMMEKLSINNPDDLTFVELKDYKKRTISEYIGNREISSENKVAVIYAIGEIGMGESDEQNYVMGGDDVAEAIKAARLNDKVKAVVLRVNSPGGGVLPSDVIWREMVRTKETKKVVVSMGDLAASGGYYISTPSDLIMAQENTITGSIGVFGVIPDMQELNEDLLGLSFDEVKTNKHADFFDFTRPMRTDEKDKMQLIVDNIYQSFISKVSESRGLTIEQVDDIAQGRVWAGTDAKDIGLVDEIGGLEEAIAAAANLAEIQNDYGVINYPIQELDPVQELISTFVTTSKTDVIEAELGHQPELLNSYRMIKRIKDMSGLQMRMSYEMQIR